LTVYPAWIRASIKNESDPQHLFEEVRRFFTDRSLLVEQSQAESSFKGSFTTQKRRVIVEEDKRTKEECQIDQFRDVAKMYGYGEDSQTRSIKVSQLRQSSIQEPVIQITKTIAPQKRKFVVKVSGLNFLIDNESIFRRTLIGQQITYPIKIRQKQVVLMKSV
jgi:hypothetical protein